MAEEIERPRFSFEEMADALTPQLAPGVSRADLFAALKGARVAPAGTTCAACSAHGVLTSHSPASEEHATWTAKWAQDASWLPPGEARGGTTTATRWCYRCGRPEPADMLCPAACADFAGTPCGFCGRDVAEGEHHHLIGPSQIEAAANKTAMPADPFPDTDVLAGMGIAQMLAAMEAGGVDPLRAERIIGAMLAAHGLMAKEAEG